MANIIKFGGNGKPSSSLVASLTAEPGSVRLGKTFIGKNNQETQTGTMPNAVVITPTGKSATAKVTGLTYTYNSTNDNFTVAHSSQASATVSVQPSVSTAGYISSSEGTKTANNVTAYGQVATTVAKVGTGVTISGTTTKAPSITRTAKPSGDAWTDAASGAATTTKPTSGVYVQVKSAANTGTLTATPKVTSNGYGTTSNYGATAGTATVGAAASAATYIPITNGTISGSVGVGGTYTSGAGKWVTSVSVTGPTLSGTATTAQVLTGYSFYSNSGTKQNGAMANRGNVSQTLTYGGSYTIPQGYHGGSGKVSCPALSYAMITGSGSAAGATSSEVTASTVAYSAKVGGASAYTYTVHLDGWNGSSWVSIASSTTTSAGRNGNIQGTASGYSKYRLRVPAGSSSTMSWGGMVLKLT